MIHEDEVDDTLRRARGAALSILRNLSGAESDRREVALREQAQSLAEAFMDLDEWLSKGGEAPITWWKV